MRLATTLIPALHALRVHRLRTGLALLGICFGVAAVILIVAWGSIGRAKLEAEISELGADVLVVLPGVARSEGVWRTTGSLRTVTEADADAIAREAVGIAASAPLLLGSVQVVYGNHNQATTLRGVTPAWFAARPWPLTMGRPLAEEDVRRSAKVVLLGHGIAKILFGEDDPSGRVIRINQVLFMVIGVLEEKGHSLGGDDLDDQVIVPLTTARKRILGFLAGHPTAVGGVTLRVADRLDMGRTSDAVRDLLRQRHRLGSDSPDDFVVRDLAAAQRAQSRSALLMTLMLAGAAAVSLLVGGIGIMNLMLVSVNERRQEIGLRMAIGARPREIGLQFLIEAGLLALLGSGAGVVLALGGAAAFGAGSAIWNPMTGAAIIAAVTAATLITMISALYPARKAARLDPADALAQDPGSYSQDWPKRMIRAVAASTAARAAARMFQVPESTEGQSGIALRETPSASASKRNHRQPPLEQHAAWLLGLITEETDLTLQDIQRLLLQEKGLSVSIGSVWRFYDRHGIRFRRKPARRRGPSQGTRGCKRDPLLGRT
jgi:putative ABC transport system permease protein